MGHYNADALGVHREEMLDDGSFAATGKGIWVTHEDVNPATGEIEDKHFWLVEHDRLVSAPAGTTTSRGAKVTGRCRAFSPDNEKGRIHGQSRGGHHDKLSLLLYLGA